MTDIEINDLRSLLATLRAEGVSSFQHGDLRVEFAPRAEGSSLPDERERPAAIPPELRGLPPEYLDPGLGLGWKVNS